MDTLPTELADIIYNYVHQLNTDEVNDKLIDEFSNCDMCDLNKHIKIQKMVFCNYCNFEFCNKCKDNLECTDGKICNSCFFEQNILWQIQDMIDRPFNKTEVDTIIDILSELEELEKKDVLDFLYFLGDEVGLNNTDTIFNDLINYIEDHF